MHQPLQKKRKLSAHQHFNPAPAHRPPACIETREEHHQQEQTKYNGYMTFTGMASLVAALSGLDVFNHVLNTMNRHEFHLHVEAIGYRAFGDRRVMAPVLHLRASQINQSHVDAQDLLLKCEIGSFPLLGEPRGTLQGTLINVTNTKELYTASAKLFNIDPKTMNIFSMEGVRKRRKDEVLSKLFNLMNT